MAFRTHARHAELARRHRAVGTAKPNGAWVGNRSPPPGNFRPPETSAPRKLPPRTGLGGGQADGAGRQRDARRAAVCRRVHTCAAQGTGSFALMKPTQLFLLPATTAALASLGGETRRHMELCAAIPFANGTRSYATELISARCESRGVDRLNGAHDHADTKRHAPQAQ
jgi:hypothetical protein